MHAEVFMYSILLAIHLMFGSGPKISKRYKNNKKGVNYNNNNNNNGLHLTRINT